MMILDENGVIINTEVPGLIGGGFITSSTQRINFLLNVGGPNEVGLRINSVITDNGTGSVGLNISGARIGRQVVTLTGDKSNSFTGETIVSGPGNYLGLDKGNGIVAIQGNIKIMDGSWLRFDGNNQLSKTSIVTLNKGGIYFRSGSRKISNYYRKLEIENSGSIQFSKDGSAGTRRMIIDEISISDEDHLYIRNWQHGRDFLLIRKGKTNMNELIKKTRFLGYNHNLVHYREHDANYWELSALPEPKTYGAILGAAGLALASYRSRRRRPGRPAARTSARHARARTDVRPARVGQSLSAYSTLIVPFMPTWK